MKKSVNKLSACFAVSIVAILIFTTAASAYWVWTPGTKKFINPKYAVKDSPKEQFDWAMSFYNAKDYQRAAAEFEKLVKQYEYSEYASRAQYRIGLSYENMGKYYIAFQNYQKTIDNFPHIDNIDEIIAREYNIGKMYESKQSPKVLGTDIMTSIDRAIEIYKKVVDNAPYGKIADEAQFSLGNALKRAEMYDEAVAAFQKLADDYPTSALRDKAKYEVTQCAYKASLKPAYDIGPTDKAIKALEEFNQSTGNKELLDESDKTMKRLKDKSAEKSMMTARFYESQKHYQSAIIYYQDVLDRFPDSSFEGAARAKVGWLKERLANPKARMATPPRKSKEVKKEASKSWFPTLQFGKKSEPLNKPADLAQEAKTQAEKKPKPKSWLSMFKFGKKSEPIKQPAAEVIPKPKPKSWFPFKFGKKAEPIKQPVTETAPNPEKKPKPKSWLSMFKFGKKSEPVKKPMAETKVIPEIKPEAKEEPLPAETVVAAEKPVETVKAAAPAVEAASETKPEAKPENPAPAAAEPEKSIEPDIPAPETKLENPETGPEAKEDEVESSVEKLKE